MSRKFSQAMKYLIVSSCLALPHSNIQASEKPANSAPPPEAAKEDSSIKPEESSVQVSRRVELPPFEIRSIQGEETSAPVRYDFSSSRFTIVIAMATWSKGSKEVADHFLREKSTWSDRKVQIVALFTHDTEAEATRFLKESATQLPFSVVGLSFVSSLKNPKVPTVWIVSSSGQIVDRKERPDSDALKLISKNVLAWTEF